MKPICTCITVLILLAGTGLTQPGGPARSGTVLTGPGTPVEASSYETKAHGGWGDFPPQLTLDGDRAPASSWRAENTEGPGAWIQYDLGDTCTVNGVGIAFLKGAQRRYAFNVSVSLEREEWTDMLNSTGCGTTSAVERFAFPATPARFVRITGFGNTPNEPDSSYTFGKWINITETEIYGTR